MTLESSLCNLFVVIFLISNIKCTITFVSCQLVVNYWIYLPKCYILATDHSVPAPNEQKDGGQMISKRIENEKDAKNAVRTVLYLMTKFERDGNANEIVLDLIRWLEHYAGGQKHLVRLRTEAPDQWKGFVPDCTKIA